MYISQWDVRGFVEVTYRRHYEKGSEGRRVKVVAVTEVEGHVVPATAATPQGEVMYALYKTVPKVGGRDYCVEFVGDYSSLVEALEEARRVFWDL